VTESKLERRHAGRDREFYGVCDDFIAWCKGHPGEWYHGDKARHLTVLLAGMWAGAVAVVKRTEMERFTIAKCMCCEGRGVWVVRMVALREE
jgi:hypothetical protein